MFGAWQRALAQKGLTAGRFFSIYDLDAAIPIENPVLKERFEARRAADMDAILGRIDQVEVERAYRIIGVLEQTARAIEEHVVPTVREARRRWKRRTLWFDGLVFGGIAALALAGTLSAGYWQGLSFSAPWLTWLMEHPVVFGLVAAALLVGAGYVHLKLRKLAAASVAASMRRLDYDEDLLEYMVRAFEHNSGPGSPCSGPSRSGGRPRPASDSPRYSARPTATCRP